MLMVLGILAIITGTATAGLAGFRRWLAHQETRALILEVQTACRLYRMDHGEWPASLQAGEQLLTAGGSLLEELASYLEHPVAADSLESRQGHSIPRVIADLDGDRWIEGADFVTLPEADRPGRIRDRTAVYTLTQSGRLGACSWNP